MKTQFTEDQTMTILNEADAGLTAKALSPTSYQTALTKAWPNKKPDQREPIGFP